MKKTYKKLKAAVVGCGYAGLVDHIPWYAVNPDVELVALVDSNLSHAKSCAKRWGGRPYGEITQMIDREKPHVVSICTPVHLHAQHTLECLNNGSHVLCEKPMAPSLNECQEMIDCAKRNELILGIVLDKRFSEEFRIAREIICSERIGKPLFARIHWSANLYEVDHGFRGKIFTGGGVFQDCGSHFVDLVRWYFGAEVSSVQGMIALFNPEVREVEDHAVALLQLNNGLTTLIESSWIGSRDYKSSHIEEVWVYGTKGVVKATGNLRIELPSVDLFDRKTNEWHLIPASIDIATFEGYQYKRMIDEFIGCVQQEKEFIPSGEDGKKSIEVVLSLYESWKSNRSVELPLAKNPDVSEIFKCLRERSLRQYASNL